MDAVTVLFVAAIVSVGAFLLVRAVAARFVDAKWSALIAALLVGVAPGIVQREAFVTAPVALLLLAAFVLPLPPRGR